MTEKIDVYANGVIGGDSPADYGEAATEVVKRGYEMTKFVPFDQPEGDSAWPDDLSRDRGVERLRAVRDAVGDSLALGIDFHGVHAPQVAIELVERVTAFDPAFVEEPIPPENQAAMRRIRDRINVPIATGERLLTVFDYRDFLDDPTPGDIVQPDVSNCGGISQLKKIASMAYAEYVPIAPHNSRGPVATAAAAHACATIPNFLVLEYFPDLPPWRDDLIVGSEYVENGVYHLPDGPGLGIELNEDALDDHPYEKDNRTDEIFTCGFRGMR
ncbi:mandelate racemase/muconate lactonizing enzyme family protein [Halococcus sp. PRR34]|uniref:mandelate racemase/muconate lactonizing enzyme family protein n=1 Tax=Halococcus sp. PRR34 TaxID=3020830 RepID=UPI002361B022|nr:mandelate racemase/muconate lactonizing enzyme family protein [Halococcus sp. PRR34]